jgi:hypothetical protein
MCEAFLKEAQRDPAGNIGNPKPGTKHSKQFINAFFVLGQRGFIVLV